MLVEEEQSPTLPSSFTIAAVILLVIAVVVGLFMFAFSVFASQMSTSIIGSTVLGIGVSPSGILKAIGDLNELDIRM